MPAVRSATIATATDEPGRKGRGCVLKNWRLWVLGILLVGPIAAYVGVGALWLKDQGWLLPAGSAWILSGVVFTLLASRWTKDQRQLLPPIDWDAPATFSPHDRKAWDLIQEEAERGEATPMEQLTNFDIYIDTGRRLAQRLAAHYEPLSSDPIEHVPLVEMLTALELAAEDLGRLCRQVPGGDLVTMAHYKRAMQAAGYYQKASDIYSYLLPIFNPLGGLARLGAQKLMVAPAWKNMQQNLLRWFYRAYVNRLGTHLVELYSHRLVIGSDQYRRLTRRVAQTALASGGSTPLAVGVAGARGPALARAVAALDAARAGDRATIRTRLASAAADDATLDRIVGMERIEIPGYKVSGGEAPTARDRETLREAVAAAVELDLLVLVVDPRRQAAFARDLAFAADWSRWLLDHPNLEAPPVLVVVAGPPPQPGGPTDPNPLDTLRGALPTTAIELVAVDLEGESAEQAGARLLTPFASLVHRGERAALIRHLQRLSARSKARHLVDQVGRQGRQLWGNLKSSARRTGAGSE